MAYIVGVAIRRRYGVVPGRDNRISGMPWDGHPDDWCVPTRVRHDVRMTVDADTDLAGAAYEVWLAARLAAGEPPAPSRCARIREKLADTDAHLLVERRGTVAVGMLLAQPFRGDDGTGAVVPGWGHVSMVFVRPDWQGRGIGGRLLDDLVGDGRWPSLSVWTRGTNLRAQWLYDSRGFRPTGDRGETPSGAATQRWQRHVSGAALRPQSDWGSVERVVRSRSVALLSDSGWRHADREPDQSDR